MRYISVFLLYALAVSLYAGAAHAGELSGMSCKSAVSLSKAGNYGAGVVLLKIKKRMEDDDVKWVAQGNKSYYERAEIGGWTGFVKMVLDYCGDEFADYDLYYSVDLAFFTYARTGFNVYTYDIKQ